MRPTLTEGGIKALRGGVEIGAKAVHAGLADGLGSLQGVLNNQPPAQPGKSPTAAQAEGNWGKAFALATGRAQPAPTPTTDASGWGDAFTKARGLR